MKDVLKSKLEKYYFKYKEEGSTLEVYLGHSLHVSVEFDEDGKIRISDQLKPWSPLTGIIPMSTKSAMTYNGVLFGLIAFLFLIIDADSLPGSYDIFVILVAVWTTMWALYYHIKSENFKRILINWIEADRNGS